MDYPGNLFVVAAPSGAGKSSLVKALLDLGIQLQQGLDQAGLAGPAGGGHDE